MNETTRVEVVKFAATLPPDAKVADLGSLNINGSVKDIIPQAVGFDIVEGPGVDVVIGHRHKWTEQFDFLVTTGAFQTSRRPNDFTYEMFWLLKPRGKFLLVTCAIGCQYRHTTSHGTNDSHRWWPDALAKFLEPEFEIAEVRTTPHPEAVIIGVKR